MTRKYIPRSRQKRRNTAIRLCFAATAVSIAFSYLTFISYKKARDIRDEEHAYASIDVIDVTKPTGCQIAIEYKNFPIGFKLVSPSGTEYSTVNISQNGTDYAYTDKNSAILIYFNTTEYGTWKLVYNHSYHNTDLRITAKEVAYNGLKPMNIQAYIKNGRLHVEFMPYTGTGNENIEINYYVLGYAKSEGGVPNAIKNNDIKTITTNMFVQDDYDVTDEFINSSNSVVRLITYQTECGNSDKYYSNVIITNIKYMDSKEGE